MSMAPKFKHSNLPAQIADHLVELIALGELRDGERMIETSLCHQLNVSRIPLREALRLLQAQGIVYSRPNRGTYVNNFDAVAEKETLEIRVFIERMALQRVVGLMKRQPHILDDLTPHLEDLRRAAAVQDRLAFCRADLCFHSKFVELSNSIRLQSLWCALSHCVLIYMMRHNMTYDYARLVEEHEKLFQAIASGKRASLSQEIKRHILDPFQRT